MMIHANRRMYLAAALMATLGIHAAAAEIPVESAWQAVPGYEDGQDMAGLLVIEREVIRAMNSPVERAACAARLAQLLEADGTTPAARQWICLQLRQVGTAAEVPLLERLLLRPETSQIARYALEAVAGEESLASLRAGLEKLDGQLLVGVIQSLAARRDEMSVPRLIALTETADPAVAAAAVWALGDIGGPEAIAQLEARADRSGTPTPRELAVPLLRCADRLLASGDAQSARRIYERLSREGQAVGVRRAALAGLLDLDTQTGEESTEAAAMILAWFADADRQRRDVAAARLSGLTNEQLGRLAARAGELPAVSRAALLELLALRAPQQALPLIREAVARGEGQLRLTAIRCLGLVGDASAIPALIDTLDDVEFAAAAQQALATLPREQVGPALLQALEHRPKDRAAVIEVLKRLTYYEAIDPLIAIARSADPAEYEAALDGLRAIADPDKHDLPRLLRLVAAAQPGRHRDEAERTVLIVCDKLPSGSDRAVPVLEVLPEAARSPEYLPLLGRLGGPQARQIIDTALGSRDPATRDAAVRGLCNWPDAAVADQLLQLARESEDRGHRQRALRAYVRVITLPSDRPEEQTLEMLQSAMQQAEQPDDRRLILTRAASVRTMPAVEWLATFLQQPELSEAACAAIVELAHHRFLRQPNMARFREILEQVTRTSRDAELIERARRYQLGL